MEKKQISLILVFALLVQIGLSCSESCSLCNTITNTCYSCKDPVLRPTVNGQCLPVAIMPGCLLYSSPSACQECSLGYLLESSSCVRDLSCCLHYNADKSCSRCGFGLKLQSGHCTGILNCEAYSNDRRECLKCSNGFDLINNLCYANEGCLQTSERGGCVGCKQGYQLEGFACVGNDVRLEGCAVADRNRQCVYCQEGLDNSNGVCAAPAPLPPSPNNFFQSSGITFQSTPIQHTFSSDAVGVPQQTFSFGQFNPPSPPVPAGPPVGCKIPDQRTGGCVICEYRYRKRNNVCEAVPLSCDPYNIETGECLGCIDGYKLTNGECVQVQKGDQNCKIAGDDGKCLYCNYGFVMKNGVCTGVNPLCKGYDLADGKCLGCPDDYDLKNGQCVKKVAGTPAPPQAQPTAPVAPPPQQINIDLQPVIQPTAPIQGDFIIRQPSTPQTPSPNNGPPAVFVPPQPVVQQPLPVQQTSPPPQQYSPPVQPVQPPPIQQIRQPVVFEQPSQPQPQPPPSASVPQFQPPQFQPQPSQFQPPPQAQPPQYQPLPNPSPNPPPTLTILNNQMPPNCRTSNQGICLQCSGGFWKNGTVCQPIDPLCQTSDPNNGLCTSCFTGYVNAGGKCIEAQAADPNCRNWANGLCTTCSRGYFVDPATKKCKGLNPLCADADLSNGNCTKCYPGYSLKDGACVVKVADRNCKDFAGGVCRQCSQGYFRSPEGMCKALNPICYQWNMQTGQCTACYNGYFLRNGNCFIGTSDPNCKNFVNGICQGCSNGYFNNNGKCTAISPLCATANSNNGDCLTCYQGYVLNGGTCVVGTTDKNCRVVDRGVCQACYGGYVIKNGKCTVVSPLCRTFDNVTGDCTSCYPGYSLNSGACAVARAPPNCKTFTNGQCQECYSGAFLLNGQCKQYNPLCRSSDPVGNCLSCYGGYLLASGNCTLPKNSDPNCIQSSGLVCLTCANRYYLDQGVCTQVNQLCQMYNMIGGDCLSCQQGYQVQNGKCVAQSKSSDPNCDAADESGRCVRCRNRFYARNGKCEQVSLLCKDFNDSTGQCVACQQGNVLQDGECVVPALGEDQQCSRYVNGYCTSCKDGFTLTNYRCMNVDPNCLQFDPTNNACLLCKGNMAPFLDGCRAL